MKSLKFCKIILILGLALETLTLHAGWELHLDKVDGKFYIAHNVLPVSATDPVPSPTDLISITINGWKYPSLKRIDEIPNIVLGISPDFIHYIHYIPDSNRAIYRSQSGNVVNYYRSQKSAQPSPERPSAGIVAPPQQKSPTLPLREENKNHNTTLAKPPAAHVNQELRLIPNIDLTKDSHPLSDIRDINIDYLKKLNNQNFTYGDNFNLEAKSPQKKHIIIRDLQNLITRVRAGMPENKKKIGTLLESNWNELTFDSLSEEILGCLGLNKSDITRLIGVRDYYFRGKTVNIPLHLEGSLRLINSILADLGGEAIPKNIMNFLRREAEKQSEAYKTTNKTNPPTKLVGNKRSRIEISDINEEENGSPNKRGKTQSKDMAHCITKHLGYIPIIEFTLPTAPTQKTGPKKEIILVAPETRGDSIKENLGFEFGFHDGRADLPSWSIPVEPEHSDFNHLKLGPPHSTPMMAPEAPDPWQDGLTPEEIEELIGPSQLQW